MKKRILFLQLTDPAAYPPIMNAATLLAKNGAEVYMLNSPSKIWKLKFKLPESVHLFSTSIRADIFVRAGNYFEYCVHALALGFKIRPHWVYASDPMGAFPALIVALIFGSKVIYHEHDSPTDESQLKFAIKISRRYISRISSAIIFPNKKRGLIAQGNMKFDLSKLKIIWNVPLISEIPIIDRVQNKQLILYYHGTITPARLPVTVLEAIKKFNGAVKLIVAGYEVPSAVGYIEKLLSQWNDSESEVLQYLGQIEERGALLCRAANNAQIGLALMPLNSGDINMENMLGASNKVFDYLAAGLPVIISNIKEWDDLFVKGGYGLACDPTSVQSIENVIEWYLQHAALRLEMGKNAQLKIRNSWNYDNEFSEIIEKILN